MWVGSRFQLLIAINTISLSDISTSLIWWSLSVECLVASVLLMLPLVIETDARLFWAITLSWIMGSGNGRFCVNRWYDSNTSLTAIKMWEILIIAGVSEWFACPAYLLVPLQILFGQFFEHSLSQNVRLLQISVTVKRFVFCIRCWWRNVALQKKYSLSTSDQSVCSSQ